MPRPHLTPRKTAMSRKVLGIALMVAIILTIVLPRSSKKRCTPTSTESYCPHPKRCVDTKAETSYPRPLIVIAAGGERAASTFLFNALRILLRIRDPNTVSGWYADLQQLYNRYAEIMARENNNVSDVVQGNRIQAFRSVGSLLVKIHTVRDWHDFLGGEVEPVMDDVDAVFTSHRDIRNVVRSIRDMGWGVSHTDSQMSEEDFCRKKRKKKRDVRFFNHEDYKRVDTWVTVARTQIICREILLQEAGSKLKMDLKAEDVSGINDKEMKELLGEMSHHLNYTYSDEELQLAVKELRKLRVGGCDNGYNVEMGLNPVTHLHKGHVRKGVGDDDEEQVHNVKSGMMAIQRDGVCRRWLQQHLYE